MSELPPRTGPEESQEGYCRTWEDLRDSLDYLDDDGYPTRDAEDRIALWDWKDADACFDFMRSLWRYPLYWSEKTEGNKRFLNISTAGWSGNESLINALELNHRIWFFTWISSRRGGHYEFEIRKLSDS